jgi:hypothetical protein
MRATGLALAMATVVFQPAIAADPACAIRAARSGAAWAIVVARADTVAENAFAGRGDHCDVQDVEGRALKVLKGPLREGQALRFALSQGACGAPDSVNDDFVEAGTQLAVVLQRTPDGEVYQTQAESPAVYAAKEQACGRPVP